MITSIREDAPTLLVADRERLLGRLERAARRTRRRGDFDAIHDVRVATRQLEASLDLWRSILPRRRRRRARRALGAVRRNLSPARDLRMCLSLLHECFATVPPEARSAAALLQDLLRQPLQHLEARAALCCGRREIARLRRRFERAWEDVVPDREGEISFLEAGRARLAERRSRGRQALVEAAHGGESEMLHSARVAAKRWRYGLERFAAADPAVDCSERAWLKAVQEVLGRSQDLAVLRRRAMRMSLRCAPAEGGVASEAMRSLLESLEASRAGCVRKFCRLVATASEPTRPFEAGPAASRG